MNTEKAKMLQKKASQAANFALYCLQTLEPMMTYPEWKERIDDAREYQRQARFLSACARQEMGF